MRILVIDDDVELCSLLGEFLKREGFTVEFRHDGVQGLARLAEGDISLIVLDVMLPGIDGFEVLRRLRQNGVILDPAARSVESGGRTIELTTFEFDILEMLMRAAGRVLSRDALMESLYNRKSTPFDRSIDMHVSHLRKKLETDKPLIKTIRGVGYQFLRSAEDEVQE